MVDMSYFIGILMVFVTAYGITLQAIIYPQSTLGWSRIIGAIFKRAFFQIDGEHFLEELDGKHLCLSVQTLRACAGMNHLQNSKLQIRNNRYYTNIHTYLTNHRSSCIMHPNSCMCIAMCPWPCNLNCCISLVTRIIKPDYGHVLEYPVFIFDVILGLFNLNPLFSMQLSHCIMNDVLCV